MSLINPLFRPLRRLLAWIQYPIPHHRLSRLVRWLMRNQTLWFKDNLIRWFVKRHGISLEQARYTRIAAYPHFEAFFTRALRPEARPITQQPDSVASPADGTVSQAGRVERGRLLQAKGRTFSLVELLGGSAPRAQPFEAGDFCTVYLSPRDYHRVHMPLDGTLREMVHIPGRLFSVNPATLRHVPRVFARNERVVCRFDTEAGPMAVVLVGALIVGGIETTWAGEITPPSASRTLTWRYPAEGEEAVHLARGEELGRFNLGSTVILLFGPERVRWSMATAPGSRVLMGERLGSLTQAVDSGAAS
jgi:phosphatidylserine decarboxylase